MGVGPIGLLMLQAAKLKNPLLLIAVDTDEHRLEIAKELGADLILNPKKEDVVKKVKELSGGLGCDAVLEVTGNPKGVENGCRYAAARWENDGIRCFYGEAQL